MSVAFGSRMSYYLHKRVQVTWLALLSENGRKALVVLTIVSSNLKQG